MGIPDLAPRATPFPKVETMLFPAASAQGGTSLLAESGTNPAFAIVVAFAILLTGAALYLGLRRRNQG
jgi:hypothetical protein